VLFCAGLLNSPSKARVQDLQIDTGILSWGDPTDSQRNIGKLCLSVCTKILLCFGNIKINGQDH
jgi:hypothetical protein